MFRPRNYAIKTVSQQIRAAENEMKRAKELLELCNILPDVLIPGRLDMMLWSVPQLTVPYNTKWYLGFEKELKRCGWERRKSYRDKWGDSDTSRYFTFHHKETDLGFYINMDASKKDSVCQLIELGEKEVIKKQKIYEIICPEGENVLDGVVS